jgi:hypoxanthine phosphoribosyltransferase
MQLVKIHDKLFQPYIQATDIQTRVLEMSAQISADYHGLDPLFIAILNGSFIFAADLFRYISIPAEISFIKLASYKGTTSTGNVITAIGLDENLSGRHIVILEDIVDTGRTLNAFLPEIWQRQAESVKIASFLTKPTALQFPEMQPQYVGFEIPDNFVVGYGLDYDGQGRNLADLYTLAG